MEYDIRRSDTDGKEEEEEMGEGGRNGRRSGRKRSIVYGKRSVNKNWWRGRRKGRGEVKIKDNFS